METSPRILPAACRGHVDEINKALAAGDDEKAFYLAYQYFRARRKHIRGKRRQQDADGFCRQGAHLLAGLAGKIHDHSPAEEFRSGSPLVPGGDWHPRETTGDRP